MPLDVTCAGTEKILVTAAPDGPLDGDVLFTPTSGQGFFERVDPTSGYVMSDGDGATEFSVTADADLGEGIVTLTDTLTLHTTPRQASTLGLTASGPVPR